MMIYTSFEADIQIINAQYIAINTRNDLATTLATFNLNIIER